MPPIEKEHCSDVAISAETMHVNEVPLLTSISYDVNYGSVGVLDNLKCPALEYEIQKAIRNYSVKVSSSVLIAVDIQFKSLKDLNQVGMKFNVASKEEHAPIIERYHRVIEERCHCCYSMLPFENLPRQMVVQLLNTVVFFINTFVWKRGHLLFCLHF